MNRTMSCTAALTPSLRQPPIPDGKADAADRRQIAGTFAGLAATPKLPRRFIVTVPKSTFDRKIRVDVDVTGTVTAKFLPEPDT